MALFIPGGPAGSGPSGKLGGIVFSHNRFGAYMRTRVVPTNPSSADQQTVRNYMSQLTNAWYNILTSAQRDSWETYAANVPVTNRIGQQIYLTGLNWYVACNSARLRTVDLTRIDDGPTVFNMATFNAVAVSASAATQLVSFIFDDSDDWALDDGALCQFGTRPQNASINYNAQPFRYGGRLLGDTAVPPTSPGTFTHPFVFVAGQRIWVRFNCVNPDGRIGPEQVYSVVASP